MPLLRPLLVLTLNLLAATAVLAPGLRAQSNTAQLRITVVDTASRPIAGAGVFLSGRPSAVRSVRDGVAVLSGVSLGDHMLEVRHPNYDPQRAVIQVNAAAELYLRVTLAPASVVLEGLTVTGERVVRSLAQNGFYERQQTGIGRFVTRKNLDRYPQADDVSALLMRTSGFTIERTAGSFILYSRRFSGFGDRRCRPAIRLDGMQTDEDAIAAIPLQEVEAVEIYEGDTAPVQYTSMAASSPEGSNDWRGGCGMVLVWTRR